MWARGPADKGAEVERGHLIQAAELKASRYGWAGSREDKGTGEIVGRPSGSSRQRRGEEGRGGRQKEGRWPVRNAGVGLKGRRRGR